jgi:small subunit ribosomal protein S1
MAQSEENKNVQSTTGSGNDFQSLFEESMFSVKPGEVVKGKVVGINETHVMVDVGYKTEGQVPIEEFRDREGQIRVKVGDDVDVFFDSSEGENGGIVLSHARAENMKAWEKIEKAYNEGTAIEGLVVDKVKGGFKVDVGMMGFLPGSQVDIRPSRNLDKFVGKKDRFLVLKFNRMRGNVVVSRRALIEKERGALRKDTLKVLEEGVILEGTVKTLTGYAAFVDVGGIDGIVHITDMSWGRIGHPSEVVHIGERVKVVVLKFDAEKERLSLGMKQLMPDPWGSVREKYPVGARVQGRVVSLADYGAFVELEKGVEGLIHVSEMSWTKKTLHPSKLLQVDQVVEVLVLNVEPVQRRIALGLKQVIPNPWVALKDKYPMGTVIQGPVRNVTDFGLFVEVEEGIDGLVHVSDLHWTKKVKHPSELYKKGDVVEAKVLGVDVQNQRLSLGIKQLAVDPWQVIAERYPVGSKVKGEVTSVPDFGVFVRVEEGVEGLVHVSQLSQERVEKPSSLYKVGDPIEAEVLHIDKQQRRIGLSVRALKKTEERQEMENYLKKEREGAKFSFETILNEELRLDREDTPETPDKRKGGNP